MKRYDENEQLNAWYAIQGDDCVVFGFFDELDEYMMPLELVTDGYHYEKGGEKYRQVCEWIESIKEGEKA